MPSSVNRASVAVEDQRLDRVPKPSMQSVRNLDQHCEKRLQAAKAGFGAAVNEAMGDAPNKTYGDDSFIAKVKSGEKVPEYLARIYDDVDARRRLGFALLKGTGVVKRNSLWWDEEIG